MTNHDGALPVQLKAVQHGARNYDMMLATSSLLSTISKPAREEIYPTNDAIITIILQVNQWTFVVHGCDPSEALMTYDRPAIMSIY